MQVKTQLAEKALQAAKAAEAALAGKQAVVEQLQQEVKEAEAVVAENTAAIHQQQGTVNAAIQAAQQATAQVRIKFNTFCNNIKTLWNSHGKNWVWLDLVIQFRTVT